MKLFDNVATYFNKKLNKEETGLAPEGVCPNCWGKQEWEGEFFKIIKSKDAKPESQTYNNFIKDVVKKLDKITLKKDDYTCETCNVSYKKS
jgi:hypothetical protein